MSTTLNQKASSLGSIIGQHREMILSEWLRDMGFDPPKRLDERVRAAVPMHALPRAPRPRVQLRAALWNRRLMIQCASC